MMMIVNGDRKIKYCDRFDKQKKYVMSYSFPANYLLLLHLCPLLHTES